MNLFTMIILFVVFRFSLRFLAGSIGFVFFMLSNSCSYLIETFDSLEDKTRNIMVKRDDNKNIGFAAVYCYVIFILYKFTLMIQFVLNSTQRCFYQVRDLLGRHLIFMFIIQSVIILSFSALYESFYDSTELINSDSYLFILIGLYFFMLSVLAFPSFYLSWLTEPLGLVKISYYLGKLAQFSYRRNNSSGSVFSAIMAWYHCCDPNSDKSKKLLSWIKNKSTKEVSHLNICHLLLENINSANNGDRYQAMANLYYIDCLLVPRRMHRQVALWLLAYDANQNNWSNVERIATQWQKKMFSWHFLFFKAIAKKMSGKKQSTIILWLLLIMTFEYRYLKILTFAVNTKHRVTIRPFIEHPIPSRTHAIELLILLNSNRHLRENNNYLHEVGQYWQLLLKSEPLKAHLTDQISDVVSQQLSTWAEVSTGVVAEHEKSHLIENRLDNGHHALMEQLEYHIQALKRRLNKEKIVSVELEWQQWTPINRLYTELKKSPGDHYIAYQLIVNECALWASGLWNDREFYLLSSAVFSWLYQEAQFFNDRDYKPILRENAQLWSQILMAR